MSEPRIAFHADFPSTLETEVEALLRPFLWLVPEYRTIQVMLKGASAEVAGEAAIRPLRRYHTAHLYLDPDFWALTHDEKEITLIHELFHLVTNVYTHEVHRVVDAHVSDNEFVADLLDDAEETLVDRLAWIFHEGLYGERKEAKLDYVLKEPI